MHHQPLCAITNAVTTRRNSTGLVAGQLKITRTEEEAGWKRVMNVDEGKGIGRDLLIDLTPVARIELFGRLSFGYPS